MRKLTLTPIAMFAATLAALPLALAVPTVAQAAPCRDAKGQFVKCPAPAVKTTTRVTAKAVAKPAPAPMKVTKTTVKVTKGPCKDAKGKFIKCK